MRKGGQPLKAPGKTPETPLTNGRQKLPPPAGDKKEVFMKVFTMQDLPLQVVEGAEVKKLKLSNGVIIDTVQVGEQGRGRQLGVIPVQLQTPWDGDGERIIKNAKIGQTLKGSPKFFEIPAEGDNDEDYILVLRTPIGHRGSSEHFVVCKGEVDKLLLLRRSTIQDQDKEGSCTLPSLKVLAQGIIAQGLAGMMGAGEQYVLQVSPPMRLEIHINGRLYGEPSTYNIYVEKTGVSVLTPEEEALL